MIIEVKDVWKKFKIYSREIDRLLEFILRRTRHSVFWALRGVSLTLKEGESVGIIGANGAGKSTLLKIISGILKPDRGEVKTKGRIVSILELGAGFDPNLTAKENIYLYLSLLGLQREEIKSKVESILEFAELKDFAEEPIKFFSSGMTMRLAFSCMVFSEANCLLIDEGLSVGDVRFQQKSFRKILSLKETGVSSLIVSHDLNALKVVCDRLILLHKGKIVDEGEPTKVINTYYSLIAKFEKEVSINEFGTKEIVIKGVELRGEKGGSKKFSPGEGVTLRVKIRSFIDKDDVSVGFLIKNRLGIEVYGTNTKLLGYRLSLKKNKDYEIVFKFPANFGLGEYTLTVAVHEGEEHSKRCFHWLEGVLSFTIVGENVFVGTSFCPTEMTFLEES